jgi:hypothetical protein
MIASRSFPFLFGILAVLSVASPSWAQWTSLTLQVDIAPTTLTLDANLQGDEGVYPFEEQSPGSMTSHATGTIHVDLFGTPGAFTQIRFQGGSQVQSIPNAGLYQPGDAPADFAAKVNLPDVIASGAFRNDVVDLVAGTQPIDGLGNFSTTGLTMFVTSGTFYYDVPGIISGSNNFYFSAPVLDLLVGTVQTIGNQVQVKIPYSGHSSTFTTELGLTFNYGVTGVIVGTATVPEPATWTLVAVGVALAGAPGCWNIKRRASS